MLVRAIRSLPNSIKHLRFFYDARTRNDTIYAPSTEINAKTGSPVGIVRLSGSRTNEVITKLTNLNTERDKTASNSPPTIKARHATVTKVRAPSTGELIDVGMVLWFPKPKSYTGEDVCELHLHGSQVIMRAMMETLGTIDGLRPAEPGEFTRRAVMNGKMSLLQAESLHDLITSQTDCQRKIALKGLDGSTRSKYENWIEKLIGILAHLEASIDFGEDELIGEESTINNCIQNLTSLSVDMRQFIEFGTKSKDIVRNGIRIAILGKPNVGKSTLMNLLCRCDKSIVSDLSGTTRDVVEHQLELGGHAVTLCDTAGLKKYFDSSEDSKFTQSATSETNNLKKLILQHNQIEQEGVKRAIETAAKCNVVLYLVDGRKFSNNIDELSKELIQELENLLQQSDERESKLVHIIVNKIDLISELSKVDSVNLREVLISSLNLGSNLKVHLLSCKTQLNFQELVDQLTIDMNNLVCCSEQMDDSNLESKLILNELSYINERHLSLLKSSHRHLEKAAKLSIVTVDEMAQHVREALDYLSRIVGLVSNEQVFDVIFKDFCIGK